MFLGINGIGMHQLKNPSSGGGPAPDDSGNAVSFTGLTSSPTIVYDSYINTGTVTSYCRKGFDPLDATLADIPSNTNDAIGAIRDNGSDAYHAVVTGNPVNKAAQHRGALNGGTRSALKANGTSTWFQITDGNTIGYDSFLIAIVLKLNQPTVHLPILGSDSDNSYLKIKEDEIDVSLFGNNLIQSFTGFNSSGFNICIFKNQASGRGSGFRSYINSDSVFSSSATTLVDLGYFNQYLQYSIDDQYFDGEIPYFALWSVNMTHSDVGIIYSTLSSIYGI